MVKRDFEIGFYLGRATAVERKRGKNPNIFNPTSARKEARQASLKRKGEARRAFRKGYIRGLFFGRD